MGLIGNYINRKKSNMGGGNKIDISGTHMSNVIKVKDNIAKNALKIENIILLCESLPNIYDQMQDILIDVKYANPVVKKEVDALDIAISNKLDDIKLMLSRANKRSELSLSHAIRDLKELIIKRQSYE